MKTCILTLIFTLTINALSAQQILITGQLSNCKSKKYTLKYDKDNPVCNTQKILRSKTNKSGNFEIRIDDLRYKSFANWIKIGSRKIYLYLEPGDTIQIEGDRKNVSEVIFSGSHPEGNHFIHDYETLKHVRKNPGSLTLDSGISLIKQYYISDSLLLIKGNHNLDDEFVDYFSNYLKIYQLSYLSSIGYPDSDCNEDFIAKVSGLDLSNNFLRYNVWYYSCISGYLCCVINREKKAFSKPNLESNLKYCDKILQEPFNESYKAYTIGYYLNVYSHYNKKYGYEILPIVRDFIDQCRDPILIEELKQLFAMYQIEL